jgi:hypothetical protein
MTLRAVTVQDFDREMSAVEHEKAIAIRLNL